MVTRTLAIVVALAACQGERKSGAPAKSDAPAPVAAPADAAGSGSGAGSGGAAGLGGATGSGTGTASGAGTASGSGAAAASGSAADPDDPTTAPAPPANDPITELGAIPAWQAVIDRAQYLDRRGQTGVVWGRLGAPVLVEKIPLGPVDGGVELVPSQFMWLLDETEGNGALGIRVALEGRPAKTGDRVALGGAWALDEERRWYWNVDALHPLPPPGPPPANAIPDALAAAPTHAIADGRLPAGARTVTVARDNDAVYFQIVGPPPVRDGEGWLVANELGDPPFARLILPGERPSYGGQDMRGPDERWVLKKAQTYWVRIGKIRLYAPDKPVGMWARTAPVRVN